MGIKKRGHGTYEVGTLTPDFGPGKGFSLTGFLERYDVIGHDERDERPEQRQRPSKDGRGKK